MQHAGCHAFVRTLNHQTLPNFISRHGFMTSGTTRYPTHIFSSENHCWISRSLRVPNLQQQMINNFVSSRNLDLSLAELQAVHSLPHQKQKPKLPFQPPDARYLNIISRVVLLKTNKLKNKLLGTRGSFFFEEKLIKQNVLFKKGSRNKLSLERSLLVKNLFIKCSVPHLAVLENIILTSHKIFGTNLLGYLKSLTTYDGKMVNLKRTSEWFSDIGY